jgi:hypothetical protein
MTGQSKQTSTLAVVSLVFGILAWILVPVIGAIVAIITGHMARSEIRRSGGAIEGDGLAVAGLVLGYVSLLLGLAVLFFVIFVIGLVGVAAVFA